jgi:hypothetical protein
MINKRTAHVTLCGLLLLFAANGGTQSPSAARSELLVFCDVSASLKPEIIRSEADIVFKLINNDAWFPNGRFAVYIADRDVERGFVLSGEKKHSGYDDENLEQHAQLKESRETLRRKLAEYCAHRAESARNKTCLVKAIRTAPRLFKETLPAGSRRILIVSDMLEDCYAQGDPKSAPELRARVARSINDYPLSVDLNGLGVFAAIVSSAADPLDVDILRTIWEKTLESTHARLTIGPIDALLPTRMPTQ